MAYLSAQNIFKTFGTVEALLDVSFSVEKGQTLVILGESGGGKTTLLRCINALELPDSGSLTLDGNTLFDIDAGLLPAQGKRREIGLVFQQFNLFAQYTALQNVMLAPRLFAARSKEKADTEALQAAALQALSLVGLLPQADHYPHQLSGGQQQRVAIARALMQQPDVLCFDEPTSALDSGLAGEVARLICSLKNEARTMIVVTHDVAFARAVADTVLVLKNGKAAAFGPAEEIFAQYG